MVAKNKTHPTETKIHTNHHNTLINAKPQDKIEIITKETSYTGILMPGGDDKIMLKLENGYNIGINTSEIKELKIIQKSEELTINKQTHTASTVSLNPSLPFISILHTGGTIASKVDYRSGAVKPSFSPEELVAMYPEISKIANIKSKLLSNMLSENMTIEHYNIIAKGVEEEINNSKKLNQPIKGIIITHGTDTLSYSAPAISFILENVNIPIILVGAQRSSDRGSSDAYENLLSALKFISQTDFIGVAVCMHKNEEDNECIIIPGTKVRKLHSSRRDAFKPVNSLPIAEINYKTGKINYLTNYPKHSNNQTLSLKLMKPLKVGLIKSRPGFHVEELKIYKDYDGLILEGTGLGHFPTLKYDEYTEENEKILKALTELSKSIPLAMTTQTIFGRVDMNVYEPGRDLIKIGVLGNLTDMTTETAYVKMIWLLSNHKKDLKELWNKNLRGEINPRIIE